MNSFLFKSKRKNNNNNIYIYIYIKGVYYQTVHQRKKRFKNLVGVGFEEFLNPSSKPFIIHQILQKLTKPFVAHKLKK